MIPNSKITGAVGAKTARACDNCIQKRARWYCAVDDAFLCQACDTSVHSANPLARRHERVRLKAASFKPPINRKATSARSSAPSWQKGFITRKARTPRHGKQRNQAARSAGSDNLTRYLLPLVPELGNSDDSTSHDGNDEEQLLYRVPIYDPFVAEFCTSTPSNESATSSGSSYVRFDDVKNDQTKQVLMLAHDEGRHSDDAKCFLPSEMELAEFAADVETLLGNGLDQETCTMEELGLLDDGEENNATIFEDYFSSVGEYGRVTVERNMVAFKATCHEETETDVMRERLRLNFDYDSPPPTCEEEDVKAAAEGQEYSISEEQDNGHKEEVKKGDAISLKLDYDAICDAWAGQGSPWLNGKRPDIMKLGDCWHRGTVACGTEVNIRQPPYGDMGAVGGRDQAPDGGREARVSRYRQKRRNRLFSKKIRYEVRKLNADKRPRMKGRFVKRSSFVPAGTSPVLGKSIVVNS